MDREGEVIEMDAKFCYSSNTYNRKIDVTKLDYTMPTIMDKYREVHGNGFSDLAWEVIELFQNRTSNNQFKRQLKHLHSSYKRELRSLLNPP